MVLSEKAKKDFLLVLEDLKMENAKTKALVDLLSKLPGKDKRNLIALPDMRQNVILSARNLPKVTTIQAKDLNTLDVLNTQYILMPKDSIKVIQNTFTEKKAEGASKTNKRKPQKKESKE